MDESLTEFLAVCGALLCGLISICVFGLPISLGVIIGLILGAIAGELIGAIIGALLDMADFIMKDKQP